MNRITWKWSMDKSILVLTVKHPCGLVFDIRKNAFSPHWTLANFPELRRRSGLWGSKMIAISMRHRLGEMLAKKFAGVDR